LRVNCFKPKTFAHAGAPGRGRLLLGISQKFGRWS
jgi:hypothetical protein